MKIILVSKNNLNVEEYTGVVRIERNSTQVKVYYGSDPTLVTKDISDWNLYVLET